MAETVVVATGNPHKLEEITAILAKAMPTAEFVSLASLGDFPDPEETGTTFLENARIKAQAALDETDVVWAVADDSGLMVDALDGAPGVHSARWAGEHGNDAANNAKLLSELAGVADPDRTARFCSCVVLRGRGGSELVGEGFCEGRIARTPRGMHGFGYDPLFMPDAAPGRTMAELAPEEKNAISHRFYALQELARKVAAR